MLGIPSLLDRPRQILSAWMVGKSEGPVQAAEMGLWDHAFGPSSVGPSEEGLYSTATATSGFGLFGLDIGQWRNMMFWLTIICVILLFAAITNPSESSFRNHLTELSFRRHLTDIRSSDETSAEETATGSKATDTNHERSHPSTGGHGHDKPSSGHNSGTETPPIAPFRFANHVAISLRTPHLIYRSLWIYSFAITSPLGAPAFLSDPLVMKGKGTPVRDRMEVYFGILGRWTAVGILPRKAEWLVRYILRLEKEKKSKRGIATDRPGVLDLRAIAPKEDPTPTTPAKNASLGSALVASKLLRRQESNPNLNDTLPLHSHTNTLPIAAPESRRSSLVNLVVPPPIPSNPSDETPSPLYLSLKSELDTATSTLADLQNQLLSQEQSVTDAHAGLQSTLDELRAKRKEDDADRHELKSRTKNLEEQRRQAESARREAEKKLKSIEGVRDGLQVKINVAQREVDEIRSQMESSEKCIRIVQEEGAKHVIATREAYEGKKKELEDLEGEVSELETKNELLGKQLKEAEERLKIVVEAGESAKRLAPEEEMMMMAAAYEAAAQEGYMYGQHQNHASQWANQAAAYMAEAGMPYLDQNYTARPAPGSAAATGTNPLTPSYGNLGRRDISDSSRRLGDVPGFEDFGPGATTSRIGSGEIGPRPVTPPISDTESDIYGPADPGSPNGGISSSFSANLLPQGLFRSLEGDATPLDEDINRATLVEALNFEPTEALPPPAQSLPPPIQLHDHADSGSESGDEAEDIWKSPMPEPRNLEVAAHRLSGGRLLPPSTTPPGVANTVAPSIPGLPSLPGNRRWFSGTASAENLNNFNFLHPTTSNDSLTHPLGYDSASPFAPSASEKKALALKWGPLSKYPWARTREPSVPISGGSPAAHRSSSAELPVTTSSPSSNWLSNRFSSSGSNHFASLGASSNGHTLTPPTHVDSPGLMDDTAEAVEDEANRTGDKKSFRFFSLRKKEGSSAGSGGGLGQSWGSSASSKE